MSEYFEKEFLDFLKVLDFGASKHGAMNWLDPNGRKASHVEMHESMQRHLTSSFNNDRLDMETGLDHLLHLAARALMMYTRIKRGIRHEHDDLGS